MADLNIIKNTIQNNIDKILNNEILDKVSKINLDEKKINYSEILFYSIIFNDLTYKLILEKLLANNNNLISDIYKFESKNIIINLLNDNDDWANKNFDSNTNQISKILDKLMTILL